MQKDERHSMAGATALLKLIGFEPGAIIDIGVEYGTKGLYSVWPGTPIVLIEPSPDCLPFMKEIAETHPGTTIFNVGASNVEGDAAVRQHRSVVNIFFGDKPNWNPVTVPVRRCDDMIAEVGLPGPYLYKLDTDSHEIEILEGSEETLKRSDVVIVEMNLFYGLKAMTSPNDIWAFLNARGFSFLDIGDMGHAPSGVLRAADFVFVREPLLDAAHRNAFKPKKIAGPRAARY